MALNDKIILNEEPYTSYQDESDKLELLRYAIENKVEVVFWYKGVAFRDPKNKKYTKQNWRYGQVTDLGKSPKTSKWMVRFWQNRGISNTKSPAWKTMLVDEMSNIIVFDGEGGKYYRPFDNPSGFNFNRNGDKKMLNGKPDLKVDLSKKPIPNQTQQPQDSEEEQTPIQENKSFFKWILNISYGKG